MQLLSLTPARAILKRRRHTSVLAWWAHTRDVERWHNPEIRTRHCTVGDSDLRDLLAGLGCSGFNQTSVQSGDSSLGSSRSGRTSSDQSDYAARCDTVRSFASHLTYMTACSQPQCTTWEDDVGVASSATASSWCQGSHLQVSSVSWQLPDQVSCLWN